MEWRLICWPVGTREAWFDLTHKLNPKYVKVTHFKNIKVYKTPVKT
jgi:hypothetical protein